MSDRIDSREVTRPEPASRSPYYDDAYAGARDFRQPLPNQQDVERYFGNLVLDQTPNVRKQDRMETPAEAVEREIAAAKKNIDELMRLAGNKVRGEDGLSKEDLTKLKDHPGLRKDLKETAEFLLKNYDQLSTTRTSEWLGGVSTVINVFQRRRITPNSLEHNKDEASADPKKLSQIRDDKPQEIQASPQRKMSESFDPRDRSDRRDPRDRSDRPDRNDVVTVKRGWGWENIARESLNKQGAREYQYRDVIREMERLQRLNPHKRHHINPGDEIVMR